MANFLAQCDRSYGLQPKLKIVLSLSEEDGLFDDNRSSLVQKASTETSEMGGEALAGISTT